MTAELQVETQRTRIPTTRADGVGVGTQRAFLTQPRYPTLFQVNTRALMTDLARSFNRTVTLDDIPDAMLDEWQARGFDWIWMLSVWTTGAAGQGISRQNP